MDNRRTSLTIQQIAAKKRLHIASIMIFAAIPVTIAFGVFLIPEEWYMPLSLAVLCMTVTPFFMIFESRKPKAREIVLIAVISALTVTSHIFFHVVLPVQIGTAMVIISGAALGPETGFLIGALSRFICNFYMGQGPWTPWQMFCWGLLGFIAGAMFWKNKDGNSQSKFSWPALLLLMVIAFSVAAAYVSYLIWPDDESETAGIRLYVFGGIGLIAGALIQKKPLPVTRIILSIFTFFTTFIVYGGIMNGANMILSMNMSDGTGLDFHALRAMYAAGVPYDFFHALTASICVFFIGESIIAKLERIKIKYGIYK